MKNRISSEYIPRIKVLIFVDFMYYSIAIIENTQAQYFDNLISKLCGSLLNNDNTVMHQVDQYNALFLATFSAPILVFVRTIGNLPIWKGDFHYNLFMYSFSF